MTKSQRPARILVVSWLGLLGLLALTTISAYLPLGAINTVVALVIATVKAGLVAAVFMELRERPPLMLVFASAGFFWLGIMLWLTFADYATRPAAAPLNFSHAQERNSSATRCPGTWSAIILDRNRAS